jgi:hypothetical protein
MESTIFIPILKTKQTDSPQKTESKFIEKYPWKTVNFSPGRNNPHFYGTLRFITMFKITHNWPLSKVSWIRATPSHPVS